MFVGPLACGLLFTFADYYLNDMKKNYCRLIAVALTMALVVVSCGDDDPITPTPEPTPDPTPTVVYNGFGYTFQLDSVAGDAEAFNTFLLDTMKFYCPELKEVTAGVYSASIVFEEGDSADYVKLRDQLAAFKSSFLNAIKVVKTPVVTSSGVIKEQYGTVEQGWKYSSVGSNSGSVAFAVLIPSLKSSVWATDDKKDTGVESLKFNDWSLFAIKAVFSGKVVVNDTDTCSASREGNLLVLLDEGSKIKYGFTIDPSGESLSLTQVGNDKLAEEAITTYKSQE